MSHSGGPVIRRAKVRSVCNPEAVFPVTSDVVNAILANTTRVRLRRRIEFELSCILQVSLRDYLVAVREAVLAQRKGSADNPCCNSLEARPRMMTRKRNR